MDNLRIIIVFRRPHRGEPQHLGTALRDYDGWRFVPTIRGKRTSRKVWATWEACLPRWVDYPDGCETRTLGSLL